MSRERMSDDVAMFDEALFRSGRVEYDITDSCGCVFKDIGIECLNPACKVCGEMEGSGI